MRTSKPCGNKRRALCLTALGSVLALFVLLLAGCGEEEKKADATVDTGGRLQITELTYDFGPVPVGQQVEHQFVLGNTGTGPLNLAQMSVKRLEGC